MSFFSRCVVAAGLFQSAFASPTLNVVPAYKATSLERRQNDTTTTTNSTTALLNDLVTILEDVDLTVGTLVGGLVTDILAGIGDDLDEADQIFSAILT
jgi:hypothetical protein